MLHIHTEVTQTKGNFLLVIISIKGYPGWAEHVILAPGAFRKRHKLSCDETQSPFGGGTSSPGLAENRVG
jgi:hypothetical protein